MFKIQFTRDIMNKDPEKRKKITGIQIIHGYYCLDCCWCDCGQKCKYRKGFKFHNFSIAVHRFFEYRLHIKLPHLFYIGKYNTNLSGTMKCPFHKSRRYTCYDCKYQYGYRECSNEKYHNASYDESRPDDPEWNKGKCKFFEKNEWADNWDRKTGKFF